MADLGWEPARSTIPLRALYRHIDALEGRIAELGAEFAQPD